MAKSSKRRPNTNGSAKKQLKRILADANAHSDPLAALPSAFLSVNLNNNNNVAAAADNNNDTAAATTAHATKNNNHATIHYYKSPLPSSLLNQCLDLFETNMGGMYKKSEWGLNMEEKKKELQHDDARFLIILLDEHKDTTTPHGRQTPSSPNNDIAAASIAATSDNSENISTSPKQEVIGFAHFRYEQDEDSSSLKNNNPITYLYELQISPSQTSNGLGQKLMTIIELLSYKFRMTKVILTVFKCNTGAMKFYLQKLKGYEVDESSPSNFEGEENESVEYEILSKRIGKGGICAGVMDTI